MCKLSNKIGQSIVTKNGSIQIHDIKDCHLLKDGVIRGVITRYDIMNRRYHRSFVVFSFTSYLWTEL
jgi:hypothetical protein